MTKQTTYASAGVDIDAANRATEKIKELARTTFNARTLSDIGSFGGMFDGAFPQTIAPGDVVLGLPSVGLHTNGYSLARKLFFEKAECAPDTYLGALNETIGEALLRPHISYLRALEDLLGRGTIKGLAHITGGGLTE